MKQKKRVYPIELLVVIAILGVLMALLGPKVFDLLSGSKATRRNGFSFMGPDLSV